MEKSTSKVITILDCPCGCGKALDFETADRWVRVVMTRQAVNLAESMFLTDNEVVSLIDGLRRWLELGSDRY